MATDPERDTTPGDAPKRFRNHEGNMDIQPTRPGRTSEKGTDRVGRAPEPIAEPLRSRGGTAEPQPVRDEVVVSDAARSLHERAIQPVDSTLTAEQAQEVSRRIFEGYYDRPDVREVLLSRVAQALKG